MTASHIQLFIAVTHWWEVGVFLLSFYNNDFTLNFCLLSFFLLIFLFFFGLAFALLLHYYHELKKTDLREIV